MPKFQVIYADPPWAYRQTPPRGAAADHYRTLTVEELARLPVHQLAAWPSALFLWGTFPMWQDQVKVLKAWGFTYVTVAFVWVKLSRRGRRWHFGTGSYSRANAEVCFLGMRGKPRLPVWDHSVPQLLVAPVRSHSQKPPEVRTRIVRLFGEDTTRLELFARERVEGWEAWGDEVECSPGIRLVPLRRRREASERGRRQ